MKYKRIIISDLHLGIKDSKSKQLLKFLKNNTCDELILNGDIIDGWALKRGSTWKKKNSKLITKLINLSKTTTIKYIIGNHDDFLMSFNPLSFGNIEILRQYEIIVDDKKYLITHGDIFDTITTKYKWISKLGDIGYTFLLWINRIYNNRRIIKGKKYFSLSQYIKNRVKTAVSFIFEFENELVKIAKSNGYDGVICGHIHFPNDKLIDGIHYLNSGDLVETCSLIVQHENDKFEIMYIN